MDRSIEEIEAEIAEKKQEIAEVRQTNNTPSFASKMDSEFGKYLDGADDEVREDVKKHNRKTFKMLKKRKEQKDSDLTATEVYQARYDRETWYYKRHKDTIDKYVKREDKDKTKAKTDPNVLVVENPEEEAMRIGIFKMWFIVWFDLVVCTFLGNLVLSPIHLVRFMAEIFYKMKKSVAVTVVIIVTVIIVAVALTFGIQALMNYARTLS